MSLSSIYASLSAQGAVVTLNDASLGTTGLDALLLSQLMCDAIIVTLQGTLAEPTDVLTFSGTTTFLYGAGNGLLDCNPAWVTVTIIEPDAVPVLNVAVALTNGWVLGASFYPFFASPFDASVLTAPALGFGFNTGDDGLVLTSPLSLVGPLSILPLLFATQPTDLVLSGKITFSVDGPCFSFSSTLPAVKGAFGTVEITNPVYILSLDWALTGDAGDNDMLPVILTVFEGDCAIVSAYPVKMRASLPLNSKLMTVVFGGVPDARPLASTDQLQPLLWPIENFAASLSPSLFGADMPFGLMDMGVQFDPRTFKVLSTWGAVGTTEAWYPIPGVGQFSIEPLQISWNVVDPAGAGVLWGLVEAGITIGTYTFAVSISYPDFVITGNLPGDVELDLANINAQLFTLFPENQVPMNPDLSAATVSFGNFTVVQVTPAAGNVPSSEIGCSATVDIELGSLALALESSSMSLKLLFPSDGSTEASFKINGIFSVEQWQFSLAAEIEESNLMLSGELLQPQYIAIGDALNSLLGGAVTGPSTWDMSVIVESFALLVDTSQALLDVNGKLDWTITVLETTFDPRFAVHVSSTGSAAQRVWSGALAGSLSLGGMGFGVGYQFGPSVSLLTGAWSTGPYDWTLVMASFGQSQPGMPATLPPAQEPNLAPGASLQLSYDFDTQVMTLLGDAAVDGANFQGFFIAATGNGFAAGIAFALPPGFFAGLDANLAMFDAFGLSELALSIANFDNPYQAIPIGSGLQGVASGINFYANFATAESDATTQDAMNALTGGQQSVQVWIAFTDQAAGWSFRFNGKLSNASLDLGAAVTLQSADVALTAATGASGFSFEVLFALTVTARPGSGTIIVPGGATEVLTFLGEIGFTGSAESFGGFMAVFMEGTWLNPFNMDGLVVSNLGLLLGINAVVGAPFPVPSIGMTGFLSYSTPTVDFEFYLAIYFDGAAPERSLFIGSINKVDALSLLDMMLWCAAGVEVPSLLRSVLSSYSVQPIPVPVTNAQQTLTSDDLAQLNASQMTPNVYAFFANLGQPLTAEKPGAPYQTVIVALKDSTKHGAAAPVASTNTVWFIADFQTGRVYRLTASALSAPFTVALVMNPWLYVVPTTTQLGPYTYNQGFGFGGELAIANARFDVIAQVATSEGMAIDASAPAPFSWPMALVTGVDVPQLLVFSDAIDASLGPSLSLSTYQQGDVPPHFYLSAQVALLGLAQFKTEIKILAEGFSFAASLAALDILDASLSCSVSDAGFAAAASFALQLTLDTPAVTEAGVTLIPAIHLDTGFAVSLSIAFPTSSNDPTQSANFSGSISFNFADQRFSAAFAFTLSDLNDLVSSISVWIVDNIADLLSDLLGDPVQWAKALANGLFSMSTALAAQALQALGLDIDNIANLLADVGRSLDEVYDALVDTLGVSAQAAVAALTQAFRLDIRYAALGQHIGPAQAVVTPDALIAWMKTSATTDFMSGDWGSLSLAGAGLLSVFEANLFDGYITLETAMYDPDMYQMHLTGFGLDEMLPYSKVNDALGVFETHITKGQPMMAFGPFAFRSPTVDISIWTDGEYLIDYGYPDNDDWSRAGAMSIPFAGISAQGGFRVQRLAASVALPASWSNVSVAVQLDAAFKLSLDAGIDVGILSGGYWMSYGGGFNGIAGYGRGMSPTSPSGQFDPSQPTEFTGSLWTGYSAGVYGSVDFGIVSASVHISLSGNISLNLLPGQNVSLSTTTSVRVGASITLHFLLFKVTISFHFETTLTLGPDLLWYATPAFLAAYTEEYLPPIAFARPRRGALATVAAQPMTLLFLPELTNIYSPAASVQLVMGLGVPYTAATPDCDFNALCRALLSWAGVQADTELIGTDGMVDQRALGRLKRRLTAKPRLSRLYSGRAGADDAAAQLDYASLVQFLSEYFTITVRAAASGDDSAVSFPIIPDLIASATVGANVTTLVDFSTYNLQPASYEDAIEDTFARFQVFGSDDTAQATRLVALDEQTASLATYVFIAYFEYLLQGASSESADQANIPFDQQIFDTTASGLTTSFRGGLQLPTSSAEGASTAPILLLTGQQQQVSSFSPSLADFSVALGQTQNWFSLGATATAFSNATLSGFQGTGLDATLVQDDPGPLVSSPTSFTLGSFAPFATATGVTWTLAPLPQNLLQAIPAAGLELMLGSGAPAMPTPLDLAFSWASTIALSISQISDGQGGFADAVYQLADIDSDKLAALTAILAALPGRPVTLTLMFDGASGLQASSTAPVDIALLRTNLSIAIQPPTTLALAAPAATPAVTTAGNMADAADFLAILNSYGDTNATGYYLSFDAPERDINALFATGTSASLTLLIARTDSGTAQSTLALATDDSLLMQGTIDSEATYFALAASLPSYQAANTPGAYCLHVSRANPEVVDPAGSNQQAVDSLYNLFTASVNGSAYATLGYAPCASPASDGSATWNYTLALPLNKLLVGGVDANPYAAIGTTPVIDFQLRDCFGNAIADPLPAISPLQLYTDPLVGPSGWLGSLLLWKAGTTADTLSIELAVDADSLQTNAAAALPLYQQAVWQLAESADIAFTITCTLDSGAAYTLDATTTAAIAAYVQAIFAYLQDPASALPQPVVFTYPLSATVTALPPLAIDVLLSENRVRNVDVDAAALLPTIACSGATVSADLRDGLSGFAGAFETAFPSLKLGTSSGQKNNSTLWAAGRALTEPSLGSATLEPTYFAPAPLYVALQSSTVAVPQFGDFSTGGDWPTTSVAYTSVDCDQLQSQVFGTIDRLLSGPFASSAYVVSPADYDTLVQARSTLAETYSQNQLTWLFEQQTGAADDPLLYEAQVNFSQALQLSLTNAYAIDAMLAFPASWSGLPTDAAGAMALYGSVSPAEGSESSTLSPVSALLTVGEGGTQGCLLYSFRPGNLDANAQLQTPLCYTVSHLALTPQNAAATWITLALPVVVAITAPTAAGTEIPVVNRFFPVTPTLGQQTAAPYAANGDQVLDDLLKWNYGATVTLQPTAQDTGKLTVNYNLANVGVGVMAYMNAGLRLDQSLVMFQQCFAQIEPYLNDVVTRQANSANILAALSYTIDCLTSALWASPTSSSLKLAAQANTTLSITLREDSDDVGLWSLVVSNTGAHLPGTLSVLPLTAAGAAQPHTVVVSTSPDYVVSYEPVDATAPVQVLVALDGLDVRVVQSARANLEVTRNASLIDGLTTNSSFVFQTPTVTFPSSITPALEGPSEGIDIANIVAAPPSGTLTDWLAALLNAVFGSTPNPQTQLRLGYEYPAFFGTLQGVTQVAKALSPVLLSNMISIDNSGTGTGVATVDEVATALSTPYLAWAAQTPLRKTDGALLADLTIYSNIADGGATLLHLPNLRLALTEISDIPG